jgi:hypothetical protein
MTIVEDHRARAVPRHIIMLIMWWFNRKRK